MEVRNTVSAFWTELKEIGNAGLKMIVFSTHLVFLALGAYFFGLVLEYGDQMVLAPKCVVSTSEGVKNEQKWSR